MLHGHERSITQIKYNLLGDLIFSASKDPIPNVWFAANGERLGTFNGHQGTIWSIDVSWDSAKFVSGAADMSVRLWDVSNGTCLSTLKAKTTVRGVAFSYCGQKIAYTTDAIMKKDSELSIMDTRMSTEENENPAFRVQVTPRLSKALSVVWGRLDNYLITSHADGTVAKWDIRTMDLLEEKKEHGGEIKDLQLNHDSQFFITASKDTTAKLWHMDTFTPIKTYKTDRPVNSAAISPLIYENMEHVMLGGGQEAMDVTTSDTRTGKFEARFFHLTFMEEFGRVKGHFGPINSLAYHPTGRGYASGAEDGYVRLHTFDDTYYQFKLDC